MLVADGKISRTTTIRPDAIRNLVSEVTSVGGNPAADLPLPDLHGDAVDLGQPGGGPTPLLL